MLAEASTAARGLWSPRSNTKLRPETPAILTPVQAATIAAEYASLATPNHCPRGVFVIPTEESLARWQGVLFVHKGAYAGAVLRFIIVFPPDYPRLPPTVSFEGEVYHPLIDPKTKIWHPIGATAQWQPGVHHIHHLLHALKRSFKSVVLDSITEKQAVNKQIWSLYNHSRHTFLAMTRQRALATCKASVLFNNPDADADTVIPDQTADDRSSSPSSPTPTSARDTRSTRTPHLPLTPKRHSHSTHAREISGTSSITSGSSNGARAGVTMVDPGLIRFRPLTETEIRELEGRLGDFRMDDVGGVGGMADEKNERDRNSKVNALCKAIQGHP